MIHDRLRIRPGRWYGWQMLPGYGDGAPYFSPIYVDAVTPHRTGRSVLTLAFFNARYAQGVTDFVKDLQILAHHPSYLVAAELDPDGHRGDRTVIISEMTRDWLAACQPDLLPHLVPPPEGNAALQQALTALSRLDGRPSLPAADTEPR